jgi:hypothetical protein
LAAHDHIEAEEEVVMANFVNLISTLSNQTNVFFVIDVPGESKHAGTPTVLFERNGRDSQLWELRLTGEKDTSGNNFVFIINKHSGLALTVPNEPRFDQGAAVVQSGLDGGDNQKWLQFSPPNLDVFIFANKHSSMVLDVKGANRSNGTPIIQNPENDEHSQLWGV